MNIAVLGGTGALGRLLAEGWQAAGHTVVLGSRQPEETARRVAAWTRPCPVTTHAAAVAGSAVVVLAVPAEAADAVVETVGPLLDPAGVVLSVMVPLTPGDPTRYAAPPEGSLAERVAARLPTGPAVAAGFHTISAAESAGGGDVLFCGQNRRAREVVARLATDLGRRGVDCGPLRMAATLERLTPLLIGINRRMRVRGAGVHITGLDG